MAVGDDIKEGVSYERVKSKKSGGIGSDDRFGPVTIEKAYGRMNETINSFEMYIML